MIGGNRAKDRYLAALGDNNPRSMGVRGDSKSKPSKILTGGSGVSNKFSTGNVESLPTHFTSSPGVQSRRSGSSRVAARWNAMAKGQSRDISSEATQQNRNAKSRGNETATLWDKNRSSVSTGDQVSSHAGIPSSGDHTHAQPKSPIRRESPKPESSRGSLAPQIARQRVQWNPRNDIPAGRVKGMSNLFGPSNERGTSTSPFEVINPEPGRSSAPDVLKPTAVHSKKTTKSRTTDNTVKSSGETDPWILPETNSTTDMFGDGTWGAAATTSGESWDDAWFVGNGTSFGNDSTGKNDMEEASKENSEVNVRGRNEQVFSVNQEQRGSQNREDNLTSDDVPKSTKPSRDTSSVIVNTSKSSTQSRTASSDIVPSKSSNTSDKKFEASRVIRSGGDFESVQEDGNLVVELNNGGAKEKKRRGLFNLFKKERGKDPQSRSFAEATQKVGAVATTSKRVSGSSNRVKGTMVANIVTEQTETPPMMSTTVASPGSTVSDMTNPTIFASTRISDKLVAVQEKVLEEKSVDVSARIKNDGTKIRTIQEKDPFAVEQAFFSGTDGFGTMNGGAQKDVDNAFGDAFFVPEEMTSPSINQKVKQEAVATGFVGEMNTDEALDPRLDEHIVDDDLESDNEEQSLPERVEMGQSNEERIHRLDIPPIVAGEKSPMRGSETLSVTSGSSLVKAAQNKRRTGTKSAANDMNSARTLDLMKTADLMKEASSDADARRETARNRRDIVSVPVVKPSTTVTESATELAPSGHEEVHVPVEIKGSSAVKNEAKDSGSRNPSRAIPSSQIPRIPTAPTTRSAKAMILRKKRAEKKTSEEKGANRLTRKITGNDSVDDDNMSGMSGSVMNVSVGSESATTGQSVDTDLAVAKPESKRALPLPVTVGKHATRNQRRRQKGEADRPHSILRTSRRRGESPNARAEAPMFDETKIADPMHRAGLRLLAAAVIPIQSEMRRFLARREALNRLWAIVTIQTYFRRFIMRRDFSEQRRAAIAIQASFRGWLARDYVEDQHYCATQIQRLVRGYLATLAVYEDIYKVTLIQSYTRMKIAIDQATYRMAFIIQMQSIIRGYLVRRQLENFHKSSILLQAIWRGYSSRLNYQFDMLDIILVQSVIRRRRAGRIAERLAEERMTQSATLIQAQWRSYDCTMNYLHFLADVLVVQSAVRRFLASREAIRLRSELRETSSVVIQRVLRGCMIRQKLQKEAAAVCIQRTWRGFVCFADYMFTIADIVIVQTRVRSWLSKRRAHVLLLARRNAMATKLQTLWRTHSYRSHYAVMLTSAVICQSLIRRFLAWNAYMKTLTEKYAAETIQRAWWDYLLRCDEHLAATRIQKEVRRFINRARYLMILSDSRESRLLNGSAIVIQTAWRRFWCFSNYVIILDNAICLQSLVRGFVVRNRMEKEEVSASLLQRNVRGHLGRRRASAKSMVLAVLSSGRDVCDRENEAATSIQCYARGSQARFAVGLFIKARQIQSKWRSVGPRRAFLQYRAAVRIQALYRRGREHYSYVRYQGAVRIQSAWRRYTLREKYTKWKAATKLQARWRHTRDRRSYIQYISARRIQSKWRASFQLSSYKKLQRATRAALCIQRFWRGFLCYTDFIFTVTDIVTVQRVGRGYNARRLKDKMIFDRNRSLAAIVVQRFYRGYLARELRHALVKALFEEAQAIQIQRCFRGHRARTSDYLASAKTAYQHRKIDCAVCIQSCWRSFEQRRRFWYVLGCVLQLQRMIRGFVRRRRYLEIIESIHIIQRTVRRSQAQEAFLQLRFNMMVAFGEESGLLTNEAANMIQESFKLWVRGRNDRRRFVESRSAAIAIQKVVRRHIQRENYLEMRFQMLVDAADGVDRRDSFAALFIQRWYRGESKRIRENHAAIKIQSFFLMVKAMVEGAIRAEKKRRKLRKIMKNRTPAIDDAILEDIWADTVQPPKKNSYRAPDAEVIRKAEIAAANELKGKHKQTRAKSVERSSRAPEKAKGRGSNSRKHHRTPSTEGSQSQSHQRNRSNRPEVQRSSNGRMIPPSYYGESSVAAILVNDRPTENVRIRRHDDDESEVSGLTTQSYRQHPPSRLSTLTQKDLEDDFDLEEAWIDTEIHNVKERQNLSDRQRKYKKVLGSSTRIAQLEGISFSSSSPHRKSKIPSKTRK